MEKMRVHQFSLAEFSGLREAWQDLLLRSTANKLFLSWDWMHSWWQLYSEKKFKPYLLGVFDEDRLVCIAPLYAQQVVIKGFFISNRLEFIGTNSVGSSGFRSEYLQFIADHTYEKKAVNLVFSWLFKEVKFDELWMNDVVRGSETHLQLRHFGSNKKAYCRLQETSTSYRISTQTEFDSYLQSLGKNTRLKLYNRRNILSSLGNVVIKEVSISSIQTLFEAFSVFHLRRWGKTFSYETHKVFIEKICQGSDKSARGVMVFLEEKLLGCTLDIDCEGSSYNLQLGFEDDVHKKVSMGSLTIGYAIERCFNSSNVNFFDLLAGEGKNSNYKTHIARSGDEFDSIQLVVHPLLKLLYKFKDSPVHDIILKLSILKGIKMVRKR